MRIAVALALIAAAVLAARLAPPVWAPEAAAHAPGPLRDHERPFWEFL